MTRAEQITRGFFSACSIAALAGCGGTEPDYPAFDGPAPTVSNFEVGDGEVTAVLRDPQGGATIGRTDYTYAYFYREGTNESRVSYAREWTWTRIDDLTWRVTVPIEQAWPAVAWHVADVDSNIQDWLCTADGRCEATEMS